MKLSNMITVFLSVLLVTLSVTNEMQIVSMRTAMTHGGSMDMGSSVASSDLTAQDSIARIAAQIIPKGIPAVKAQSGTIIPYGDELGVTFDAASQGISVLSQYEQDTRADKLTGEKLQRYIKIGSVTACEFCCGAKTMVFPDGSKACGCAHSAAMRGVAAYLIDMYGDQLTDDQIITEVNRFKATYFPRQMVQKAMSAAQGGTVDASAFNQLAPQVGGC